MNECRFRIQYVNRSDSARIGESEPTRCRATNRRQLKLSRKSPKRKIPKVRELTNYGNCSFDELAGRANDTILDCDCNRQSERLTTITTSRNYKIVATPISSSICTATVRSIDQQSNQTRHPPHLHLSGHSLIPRTVTRQHSFIHSFTLPFLLQLSFRSIHLPSSLPVLVT